MSICCRNPATKLRSCSLAVQEGRAQDSKRLAICGSVLITCSASLVPSAIIETRSSLERNFTTFSAARCSLGVHASRWWISSMARSCGFAFLSCRKASCSSSEILDPMMTVSGTAMIGLAPVLTKEDIATIVRVASTDSTLAMPAMAALSINCTAEAKAGIATIRATAAGSPQATDIDHFIAGSEGLCDRKGQSDPKAFVGRVAVAPPAGTVLLSAPDVTQVRAALNSSYTKPSLPYAKPALQVLLAVQCTQGPADVVEEMRRAWHERDSPGASDTMRDPVVQAIIATCLIEADAPSKRLTPEAVEATRLLRASIHSDDVTAVMSAVTGLAIIGSDEDIRSIADVPKRLPSLLTSVIRFAGFTCGASNLKALALIRKELTTEELRDQFDAVYKHVEAVRKQQRCGDQQ
jgi:hypothetical protein